MKWSKARTADVSKIRGAGASEEEERKQEEEEEDCE